MVVFFVIMALLVVAATFFALWLHALDRRREAEREAARQLVEADEARSRAADAERHKANLFKRVLEMEANAKVEADKIVSLYGRIKELEADAEKAKQAAQRQAREKGDAAASLSRHKVEVAGLARDILALAEA